MFDIVRPLSSLSPKYGENAPPNDMKLGHWHQTERAAPLAFSNLWHGFSREQ